jgi:cell division protein FtsB
MQHNHNLEKEIGAIDVMEKSLEAKVVKLRPDTLDPDFLEERARIMLGYMKEDEIMVIDR